MKQLLILLTLLALAVAGSTQATEADEDRFSDGELDALLAPIALYPDTVLSHILIAATYPLEVVEAERWARDQTDTQSEAILRSAENQNWDPSVQALTPMPDILSRMSDDLRWTQQLGDAFLQSEDRVLDSIQRLRQRAYSEGNLQTNDYQKVARNEGDIVIEPVQTEVVYVPYYDTRIVFGHWWWPSYPPHYWVDHRHYHHNHHRVGLFLWSPGFYLGSGLYFGGFHWSHRQVVVVRHQHRSHYQGYRQMVVHRNSHHWQHNPTHRRGVAYHSDRVARRYAGNGSIPAHRIATYQRSQDASRRQQATVSQQRQQRLMDTMRQPHRSEGHPQRTEERRTSSPQTHRTGDTRTTDRYGDTTKNRRSDDGRSERTTVKLDRTSPSTTTDRSHVNRTERQTRSQGNERDWSSAARGNQVQRQPPATNNTRTNRASESTAQQRNERSQDTRYQRADNGNRSTRTSDRSANTSHRQHSGARPSTRSSSPRPPQRHSDQQRNR